MQNQPYEITFSWKPSHEDYLRDDHQESAILEEIKNKAEEQKCKVRAASSGFSRDSVDGESIRFLSEVIIEGGLSIINLIKLIRPFIIEYI